MTAYKIVNTAEADLDFIYALFEEAIAYQRLNNFTVWNGFDKNILISEVKNKGQYKIIVKDDITCVFSVCKNDPFTWGERDNGDAIYLHRIVVNPLFRGQRQFEKILEWSVLFAMERNISFIRMDTWADNKSGIINYYKKYGFTFLGNVITPDHPDLPIQNRKLEVALLEYTVK